MNLRLLPVLLLIAIPVGAAAEPLEAGKRYESATTLEVPTYGVSFKLPSGWVGAMTADGSSFEIGKDDQIGRVFVWAGKASKQEVISTMSAPINIAAGVMLTPLGQPTVTGDEIVGDYQASDGANQYKAHAQAKVFAAGIAVSVVTVAPAETVETYRALATRVMKSVKYTKPKAPAAGANASGGPWAQKLANLRLLRFHSGSGYSEKESYNLCANSRFYYGFNASSVSQLGTGAMNDSNKGRWSVAGNQLTLTFDNGNTRTMVLSQQGNYFYLDGNKWLRESAPCQ